MLPKTAILACTVSSKCRAAASSDNSAISLNVIRLLIDHAPEEGRRQQTPRQTSEYIVNVLQSRRSTIRSSDYGSSQQSADHAALENSSSFHRSTKPRSDAAIHQPESSSNSSGGS